MKTKILFLTSVMIFSMARTGQAQFDAIYSQLLAIGRVEINQGYKLTHDIEVDYLNDDGYTSYYFTLYRGWTYRIWGVCDNDCDDLDLCLYDESNNEIDCDKTTDDRPVTKVTPKWTGRFRLQVKMYDCKINPCKFGFAVFGK
ncbi:MAG TPA: hypothetical protein PKB07_01820 [Flavilitoribacter sp.]|nr:hypothetical protein [Flavilitoribacter sp.]